MNNSINAVNRALALALSEKTKLSAEIFQLPGMSSKKFRIFLNEVCTSMNAYLEVGNYKGSTLSSAMFQNSLNIYAIDNFSQFNDGEVKSSLLKNIASYSGSNTVKFFQEDCWSFDLKKIKQKIDVFFYDGEHSEESQYKALMKFLDVLNDTFIFIVDDYNWTQVEQGTQKFLKSFTGEILYEVIFKHKRKEPERERELWWNGFAVYVLQK